MPTCNIKQKKYLKNYVKPKLTGSRHDSTPLILLKSFFFDILLAMKLSPQNAIKLY